MFYSYVIINTYTKIRITFNDMNKLILYNKEGDLIFIDGTLDEGKTCKNNTYFGNIILTKKRNFLIKDFEIIAFVPNNI